MVLVCIFGNIVLSKCCDSALSNAGLKLSGRLWSTVISLLVHCCCDRVDASGIDGSHSVVA